MTSDSPTQSPDPLAKLRALLEEETYPLEYVHKLIGKNEPEFHAALAGLEQEFPELVRQGERMSGSQKHLSVTYVLMAQDVEIILRLVRRSQILPCLLVQL
jgi:putative lipoic acid-binding regulatory protein